MSSLDEQREVRQQELELRELLGAHLQKEAGPHSAEVAARTGLELADLLIRQRNAERERFYRHVETMIEPQILARAEYAERALEDLRQQVARSST